MKNFNIFATILVIVVSTYLGILLLIPQIRTEDDYISFTVTRILGCIYISLAIYTVLKFRNKYTK